MNTAQDYWTARALLEWQVEMGADEAILDQPVDRYALVDEALKPAPTALPVKAPPPHVPPPPSAADQLAEALSAAVNLAARATSVADLALLMSGYDHCELRKGARNFVFADGNPAARVMVVCEAPGREEDFAGRPFVGTPGTLFDKMFAAIGLSRGQEDPAKALYLAPVLPWRPPGDRAPTEPEIAMLLPFLRAHINLAQPEVIVLMGNAPCQALLGQQGILRLRGQWTEAMGRPCLPMAHPTQLIRTPNAKREAWADLLSLKARLTQ